MEFTMPKSEKEKNILDIQHRSYLTYFNTSIISWITTIFSTFIAFITEKIDKVKFITLILTLSIIFLGLAFIFRSKMKKTLDKIKEL
jgi:drug/metabolite transporter (DMT)-like permease